VCYTYTKQQCGACEPVVYVSYTKQQCGMWCMFHCGVCTMVFLLVRICRNVVYVSMRYVNVCVCLCVCLCILTIADLVYAPPAKMKQKMPGLKNTGSSHCFLRVT
jgi:uncharacterized integral membrane protein